MSDNHQSLSILIVEDNPGDLFLLEELLRNSNLVIENLYKVTSAAKAVKILQQGKINLVLLDLTLPDSSGLQSYQLVDQHAVSIPIIVLTGLTDMEIALETMARGAQDYLIKGEFDEKLLYKSIQYSIERKQAAIKVMNSEQRFRSLVQNGSDMIKILDAEGNFTFSSPTIEKVLGFTPDDLLGKSVFALIHPDDLPFVREKFKQIQRQSYLEIPYFRFRNIHREWRWLEAKLTNLLEEPSVNGIVSNSRDVTEKRKVEEAIKMSEERYRNLFFNNPMTVFIWDLHTLEILEVNGKALLEYGYSREEMLKMTILMLRPEGELDKIKKMVQKFATGELSKVNDTWLHLKKNGETIYMDISSHILHFNERQAVLAIANNITDKIILEGKLQEERQLKQKEITEAMIRVQEKERYEISRELHDNVNQQLTVAMMYIATAQKGSENHHELLKQSSGFIYNSIEEIRKLSKALVTPLIKDFGLGKAIEGLIEDIHATNTLLIDFFSGTFYEEDIKYDFKLNIFRIVQEQMNNILKHAKASHVTIELYRDDHISLSIFDNGVGFNITEKRKGIGLSNIGSRAELYNAQVELKTSPGKGCRLHISFPVTDEILAEPKQVL
ncbi:MAG: PAS domain S-box protein [Sediminibacterium sp.]